MTDHRQHGNTDRFYTEQLLRSVGRLRFTEVVEREFQDSFYNPRAHAFITRWGLIPAVIILLFYCLSDVFGFSAKLYVIELIRFASIVPLIAIYLLRRKSWVYRYIRDIYTAYLFFLALSVATIIAITDHTDYGHRGYVVSLPMLVMTMFVAKPRISSALVASLSFCTLFNIADYFIGFKPLGFDGHFSMLHYSLVMLTSIVIGAFTAYVLEVAERREFLQRKIIDQDKELILLQQFELSDAVQQLTVVNQQLETKNECLDQLNQEKNEFLGIAAHDLKNPLAGISLNIASIKRYYDKMTKEEIYATLSRVDDAATRMKTLVVQLLDINRLESASVALNLSRVNILDILQTVYHDYIDRAQSKNIRVHLRCDAGVVCVSDASLLSQILDNLVSNALKFSPTNADIILEAGYIMREDFDGLRIRIQDFGPGLDESEIGQLFQRFRKLSAKPTAGEHSSGLGLSIVKKMVDVLGGNVYCQSERGRGATFIIELPKRSTSDHTNDHTPERQADHKLRHKSAQENAELSRASKTLPLH